MHVLLNCIANHFDLSLHPKNHQLSSRRSRCEQCGRFDINTNGIICLRDEIFAWKSYSSVGGRITARGNHRCKHNRRAIAYFCLGSMTQEWQHLQDSGLRIDTSLHSPGKTFRPTLLRACGQEHRFDVSIT